VNPWLVAAAILLVSLLAPLWACARLPLMDALVALELTGIIQTTILLVLAEGFHRTALFDPALVLSLMTFIGSLGFARLMERQV
jgi:multisubunit Na+/H+ antiporter MnhF subunit